MNKPVMAMVLYLPSGKEITRFIIRYNGPGEYDIFEPETQAVFPGGKTPAQALIAFAQLYDSVTTNQQT